MLEPLNTVRAELTIRRSRFIGYGFPAATGDDAAAAVDSTRRKHPDASHIVHAALTDAPGRESASVTDAGEPRGTAGRPIMEILRGSDIRNMAIVVVRYFGGTKLGTGGLARAYGDTARAVLKETQTRELQIRTTVTVITNYAFHDPIRRYLDSVGAAVDKQLFDSQVTLELTVPESALKELERTLHEISSGQARVIVSPR